MFRNSAGLPLVQLGHGMLIVNEAGRGFTLTIMRRPAMFRVYLAGKVWSV